MQKAYALLGKRVKIQTGEVMSKIKTCNKSVFVAFCALGLSAILSVIINNSAFAAGSGIITSGDARWEYTVKDPAADRPQELSIKFYDKAPSATTVVVPSFNDVKSLVTTAGETLDNDLDTYYLRDADPDQQDTDYPSVTRRPATAATTKLDMSGTSKIQIMGVKPIIDPETETELVFGQNMVLGDEVSKTVWLPYCDVTHNSSYDCTVRSGKTYEHFEQYVPGWETMTNEERENYSPTVEEATQLVGCRFVTQSWWYENYGENACFVMYRPSYGDKPMVINHLRSGGAFAGYKLKLTNFTAENLNYIGWNSFEGSTFNSANTSITITGAPFHGGFIFQGTNVKNITINSSDTGPGLFKDCQNIESITFGNNADTIVADTFAGTNLTSFDFTNTGIKNIGAHAFEGARLTEVNFTGIERIDYQAFKDNDLYEIYLPKSINKLGVEIFRNNGNMKKATVAYDTMTSGTVLPFWVVLDNYNWYDNDAAQPATQIEELIILAPYAANEEVSATHISMDQYAHHYDDRGNYHAEKSTGSWDGGSWKNNCGMGYVSGNANYWSYIYDNMCDAMYEPEQRWAKPDEKKNVIAPKYFQGMHGLKKIVVGDGYEYIGGSAFIVDEGSWSGGWYIEDAINSCSPSDTVCTAGGGRSLEKVSLPESLKGIGSLAFGGSAYTANFEMSIPSGIEYIGQAAFKRMYPLSVDVDFANLKYLGDDAFTGTMIRNIYLHDSLEYMGWAVFHDCFFINDITFDLDIYDQNNLIIWPTTIADESMKDQYGYWAADNGYASEFRGMFGERHPGGFIGSEEVREKWGLKYESRATNYHQKFGTVTFTEKAVTAPPLVASEQYGNMGYGVVDPYNPYLPTSCSGITFNYMAADVFDISATPWKVLRPYIFNHSVIGELRLPANLEVISVASFSQAKIVEELVLPDTLKVIGDGAFDNGQSDIRVDEFTPKITKLPESLEFIGSHAFWGDTRLTADAYLPNARRIDAEAFTRTSIRDVYLPDTLEYLAPGAFDCIETLRDITIDADLATLISTPLERPDTYQYYPQSLLDYSKEFVGPWVMVMIETIGNQGFDPLSDFQSRAIDTFYTVFGKSGEKQNKIPVTTTYSDGSTYTWYKYEGVDQLDTGDTYGALILTDKNVTEIDASTGFFSGLTFGTVDMGATSWTKITEDSYAFNKANIGTLILPGGLKVVNEGAFHDATIGGEFEVPATTKTIDRAAFQGATGKIVNGLPEGVKNINEAAFYEADIADDITVPSTVTHIGKSAFNAGSKDVHYDTVTVKPALTYDNTDEQLVHQIFWNADLDKLIIESSTLPAYAEDPDLPFQQEFWSMPMDEVVLKNLVGISHTAFEGCDNLTKVDATGDPDLAVIGEQAFLNNEKLDTFLFSTGSKNKTIAIKPNAFEGTGFTELGDSSTKFDLTAAKFDASAGHAFANMPKLKKVTVPRNFSGATIPEYAFYNDALLEEASVDYKITDIKNAAFTRDDNLKRIFIWGDTIVQDQSLDGYTQPTRGNTRAVVGPTIPESTDIYAYSTSRTEAYAASEQRADMDSTFYPLDEVLYLTSNHPTVLLQEDDTDFDKSDLTVYAMRRDGVILESGSWQEFDGNAYARAGKGLNFEHMAETIAEDEAFGAVWDTPVPIAELDLSNQNFANLAYLIRPATDDPAVLTVDLKHTDKYTTYLANTNIDPRDEEREHEKEPEPEPEPTPTPQPEPEPEPTPAPEPEPEPEPDTPKTLDEVAKFGAILTGSGIAVGALLLAVRRRR